MEKNIIGVYNDEMLVAPAINQLRDSGVEVKDVFTPFPVNEIIEAMKLKTKFPYYAFAFGIIGFSLTFWFLYWTSVQSYPLNFGGKPSLSLSFVIILFVMVINITVLSSLIAFFVREKKGPGAKPNFDFDGVNNDKFVLLIENEKLTETDTANISDILRSSGAVDVLIEDKK